MVGDRLDNDIFPAKEIGMRTVWVKLGLAAQQDNALGMGRADFIVDSLAGLSKIFEGGQKDA